MAHTRFGRSIKAASSNGLTLVRKKRRFQRVKNKFRAGSTKWKSRPELIPMYQAMEDAAQHQK